MTGWPNAMWNGCGGGMPAGTGVYGDSQSWSKPTTPPNSRPRPSTRGGSGGGPPDPDGDDDDEEGSASRDETRSSTAATSEIRSMLRRKHNKQQNYDRPKNSLGSVKIEEYYGDRSRYIKWKSY